MQHPFTGVPAAVSAGRAFQAVLLSMVGKTDFEFNYNRSDRDVLKSIDGTLYQTELSARTSGTAPVSSLSVELKLLGIQQNWINFSIE